MARWDIFWVNEFRRSHDVDESEVLGLIAQGVLGTDDCVRPVGSEHWMRIADVERLNRREVANGSSVESRPASGSNPSDDPDESIPVLKPITEEVLRPKFLRDPLDAEPMEKAKEPRARRKTSLKAEPKAAKVADRKERTERPVRREKPAKPHRQFFEAEPESESKPLSPPRQRSVPAADLDAKVQVKCYRCGKTGKVSAVKRGETISCRACGGAVKVPADAPIVSSSGKKKKKQHAEAMGLLEAGSVGAFIAGIVLSIVFVVTGAFIWAKLDHAVEIYTGFLITPIVGLAGLGMFLGYRGQNTLAGCVAAGVGFFGCLLGRTLFGAVLLTNELDPLIDTGTTEYHEILIEEEFAKICEERNIDQDEIDLDDMADLTAEAARKVNKLSLEEIYKKALDLEFEHADREELVAEIASFELHGVDQDDHEEENVDAPNDEEKWKETIEKFSQLEEPALRERFDAMELAELRESAKDVCMEQIVSERKLDWEGLPNDKYLEIQQQAKERASDLTVVEMLQMISQSNEKANSESRRGVFVFAAIFEMFFSFGAIGWVSLFFGVGLAYYVGSGDASIR